MSVNQGIWRDDLQTTVLALAYNFKARIGTLTLAPECCPDMSGAINLFRRIDPDVQQIDAIGAHESDSTTYVRTLTGWEARRHA